MLWLQNLIIYLVVTVTDEAICYKGKTLDLELENLSSILEPIICKHMTLGELFSFSEP